MASQEAVKDAIILAGGEGKRMRPLTADRPKAAIQISQQSRIIDLQIRELISAGINRRIILAVSHGREELINYVKDGSKYGLEVVYSIEEELLGRGGAIRQASLQLPPSCINYAVANGDNLWQINWKGMIAGHIQRKAAATIQIAYVKFPFGLMQVRDSDEDRFTIISGFVEKPSLPVNGGNYIFNRAALSDLLPMRGDIEDTAFPKLASQSKLWGYGIKDNEFWMAFDNYPEHFDVAKTKVPQLWPDQLPLGSG